VNPLSGRVRDPGSAPVVIEIPFLGMSSQKCNESVENVAQKAPRVFVAAVPHSRRALPGRTARVSRVGGIPSLAPSECRESTRLGSTPRLLWGCNKLAQAKYVLSVAALLGGGCG